MRRQGSSRERYGPHPSAAVSGHVGRIPRPQAARPGSAPTRAASASTSSASSWTPQASPCCIVTDVRTCGPQDVRASCVNGEEVYFHYTTGRSTRSRARLLPGFRARQRRLHREHCDEDLSSSCELPAALNGAAASSRGRSPQPEGPGRCSGDRPLNFLFFYVTVQWLHPGRRGCLEQPPIVLRTSGTVVGFLRAVPCIQVAVRARFSEPAHALERQPAQAVLRVDLGTL